ncbi:hypothetical protein WJX72_000946 [[Myrmecia] bisecta]|uniref:Uncharacterized protein n=1 Tax=[Myrmecia] bisecta TaxID=41462 RepID=A0AAW1PN04_9CHLO
MRDLELLAEEQDTADDSERVAARWKHHKLEYERLQQDFRKASLQVRRNAEQAAVEERRALLSSPDPTKRQQKLQAVGPGA